MPAEQPKFQILQNIFLFIEIFFLYISFIFHFIVFLSWFNLKILYILRKVNMYFKFIFIFYENIFHKIWFQFSFLCSVASQKLSISFRFRHFPKGKWDLRRSFRAGEPLALGTRFPEIIKKQAAARPWGLFAAKRHPFCFSAAGTSAILPERTSLLPVFILARIAGGF